MQSTYRRVRLRNLKKAHLNDQDLHRLRVERIAIVENCSSVRFRESFKVDFKREHQRRTLKTTREIILDAKMEEKPLCLYCAHTTTTRKQLLLFWDPSACSAEQL